jgi:DNA-binding IclR family transcriptional regulator
LFELFSMRQRPLTVGRIASELRIPQASASMLLANLSELGYVTHDRVERTYTPTIRVALLGSWINHQFDDIGSFTARLTELQERVDETVFIGIQNGAYGQYVLVLHRHKVRSMHIRSGQFRLLTGSAMGRALLSLKTDEEVLKYVHRCNAEAQEARLRVVPSEFLGIVERIRRTGYAQTRGDVTPTFGAIAAPLPAVMDLMPMAIGVGVPVERIETAAPNIIAALKDLQDDFATIARPQCNATRQAS